MKKIIFMIIGLTLLIASCQPPISVNQDQTVPHYAIVKNSLWQTTRTVKLDTVARFLTDIRLPSNPTYAEIVAEIAANNALSLTSQEWVYLDVAPDISEAPNGNVFFCNPINGIPIISYLNLTRQYIFDNYAGLMQESVTYGYKLYVDHIPPAPILAKDTTPYEWYAIYAIEDEPTAGVILYEDHCGYTSDETWHGQWITTPEGQFAPDGTPGGGWLNVDKYFEQISNIYLTSVPYPQMNFPGVTKMHVITRQIYPPLPEPTPIPTPDPTIP